MIDSVAAFAAKHRTVARLAFYRLALDLRPALSGGRVAKFAISAKLDFFTACDRRAVLFYSARRIMGGDRTGRRGLESATPPCNLLADELMALEFRVLGKPGRDNALWVRVNTGQSITRLLFDCGDGCLSELPVSEIHATDHLFFSHLHMDHIGGFDSYFRCTFNRNAKPNTIWGPPATSTVLHHRFRGFWWNLYAGQAGTWHVNDVHPKLFERYRYEISEAFTTQHAEGTTPHEGVIVDEPDYTVRAIQLEHNGPCLGYRVTESPKLNVQSDRLVGLGLRPGPWLQELKSDSAAGVVEIEGATFELAKLRDELLVETPGESIAYLTDFLLDDSTCETLVGWLQDCGTLICEAQYCHQDAELAVRNCHTTTRLVSQLAARAAVGKLVLFHLSDRYSADQWSEMLEECLEVFPATEFPEHWHIGWRADKL